MTFYTCILYSDHDRFCPFCFSSTGPIIFSNGVFPHYPRTPCILQHEQQREFGAEVDTTCFAALMLWQGSWQNTLLDVEPSTKKITTQLRVTLQCLQKITCWQDSPSHTPVYAS